MSDDKFQDYLFSYRFEGAEYSFTVPAQSMAEAKARHSAMGMARYDGEVFATIKVPERFGIGALLRRALGIKL